MTTRFTLNLQALVAAVALATCATEANGLTCFGQGGRPASAYAVAGHVCTALAPNSSVDSDKDGVCDYDDDFPEDPCESVDAGDGKTGANLKRIRDMTISLFLAKKAPKQQKMDRRCFDWSGKIDRPNLSEETTPWDTDASLTNGYRGIDNEFWLDWYDTFYGEGHLYYALQVEKEGTSDDVLADNYKTSAFYGDDNGDNGGRTEQYCAACNGKGYATNVDYTRDGARAEELNQDKNYNISSDIDCLDGVCWAGTCMADAHYGCTEGKFCGPGSDYVDATDLRMNYGFEHWASFGSKCHRDVYTSMLAKYDNELGDCFFEAWNLTSYDLTMDQLRVELGRELGMLEYEEAVGKCWGYCLCADEQREGVV